MLLNISEDFSSKKKEIDAKVGKPFTLAERKEWEGTSISNLFITSASIDIYNLLVLNEGKSTCAIELRPKGIIISFRSKDASYASVIPFFKLRIYKGKAEEYSLYKDQEFIKIWADKTDPELHKFIKKVRNFKSDQAPTRVEDL